MSNRSDSTPQRPIPDPEDDVFRHTFLWRLKDPKHAEALLHTGELLVDFINETGQWGDDSASLTVLQLRAAALDLHRVADYLTIIAQERIVGSLSVEDHRLAERAERWAGKVRGVAAAVDGEVSPLVDEEAAVE